MSVEGQLMRCAACVWWWPLAESKKQPVSAPDQTWRVMGPEGWGTCLRMDGMSGKPDLWTSMADAAVWDISPVEEETTLAFAYDRGEYQGWVVTGPDFGCVMFSALGKDKTEGQS